MISDEQKINIVRIYNKINESKMILSTNIIYIYTSRFCRNVVYVVTVTNIGNYTKIILNYTKFNYIY